MKATAALLFAGLATLAASSAWTQSPALVVQNAWVRALPGSDIAAMYFTLRNATARSVTVVGVKSPVASDAMIHETRTESGQSQMRPHEQLVVPPGQAVEFAPGGLHVMLHGLTRPLAVGDSVPLVLMLAAGGTVQVVATVRPLNAQ